ncbi:MAG TPA: MoaD/ThiS family protein, partial [Pirellulales bacterium]
MKVNVKLFAVAKQLAGADSVEFELPAGATAAAIRQLLIERLPKLSAFGPNLRFAINTQYADD